MDFAFLIHSRDYTDVQRKFKIAKFLPKSWVEFWCLHWPPVIVSKITGLKNKDGQECKGWLIGVPMTAKQMIEKRELAKKRIIQAINKAEKLGAKIVGLGALTSSVTNGGEDIVGKVGISLTTGNSLTAGISFFHIKEILNNNSQIQKISVVGATGSIGQAITKILIKFYPNKNYHLFARTKEHLDGLVKELEQMTPKAQIKSTINNFYELKESDLIIVATSAPEAFIRPDYLKNGAVIYDITQPQNISISDMKKRPDLKIYDGGLMIIPELNKKLPLGLPKNTVFACLGETMLLSMENETGSDHLGKVKIEKVDKLLNIAKKYNFSPLQLKIK